MIYRHVMLVSLVMAMFASGPISAHAVFPETEFSEGTPEPRRAWRETPTNKPNPPEADHGVGDEQRDLARTTQDNRADRQDLPQSEGAIRHNLQQPQQDEQNQASAGQLHPDHQDLRHDRQELQDDRRTLHADRKHRRGSRHKARRDRRNAHHYRHDLQADRRMHRNEPSHPKSKSSLEQ